MVDNFHPNLNIFFPLAYWWFFILTGIVGHFLFCRNAIITLSDSTHIVQQSFSEDSLSHIIILL